MSCLKRMIPTTFIDKRIVTLFPVVVFARWNLFSRAPTVLNAPNVLLNPLMTLAMPLNRC